MSITEKTKIDWCGYLKVRERRADRQTDRQRHIERETDRQTEVDGQSVSIREEGKKYLVGLPQCKRGRGGGGGGRE